MDLFQRVDGVVDDDEEALVRNAKAFRGGDEEDESVGQSLNPPSP